MCLQIHLVTSGALVFFLSIGCSQSVMSGQHDKDHFDIFVGSHDYCLTDENFSPKCLMRNEIILMISALYGRMRAGRCLEGEEFDAAAFSSDPRILGCSVDVLHLMDQKCSGRQVCDIRYADADLRKERPCNKALKNYLEADYQCVSVITEDRTCVVPASFNPVHIFYSSNMLNKLSCGTKSQPWRLEAPVGQQINISILDFGAQRKNASSTQHSSCHQYGYVIDKSAKKNVSICRLIGERQKVIYRSSGSIIDIYMNPAITEANNEEQLSFLLRIIAVGCSDLIPPAEAWLRRNDNEAVVGCYTSRQTWHLRCTGNNWVGVIGNCTRDEETQDERNPAITKAADGNNNQVLVIVAIGFLALVICLVFICCGAVCLQRYYMIVARKQWRKVEEIENLSRAGYTREK